MSKLCRALVDEEYTRRLVSNAVWGNPPDLKSRADIEYRVHRLVKRIAALQLHEMQKENKHEEEGQVGTGKERKTQVEKDFQDESLQKAD